MDFNAITSAISSAYGSWRFVALGSSVKGGLPEILKRYSVQFE